MRWAEVRDGVEDRWQREVKAVTEVVTSFRKEGV
jgi:hypothetical protein